MALEEARCVVVLWSNTRREPNEFSVGQVLTTNGPGMVNIQVIQNVVDKEIPPVGCTPPR